MTPDFFSAKVVGVTFSKNYPNNVFNLAKLFVDGEIVASLVRDKSNVHDSNAVRVDIKGETYGHLPRLIACVLAPEIDAGIKWFAVATDILVSMDNANQPGLKLLIWRNNNEN